MRQNFFILLFMSFSANAAEYTLRWELNVEPVYYFREAGAVFKKNVEQRSKNKIQVLIHESKSEDTPKEDHVAEMNNGQYDMSQSVSYQLEKYAPELALWGLPYLFRDERHVEKYFTTAHAQGILQKLETENAVGLGYTFAGGFIQMYGAAFNSFQTIARKKLAMENFPPILTNFFKSKLHVNTVKLDHDAYGTGKSGIYQSEVVNSSLRDVNQVSRKRAVVINKTDHRVITRVLFISKKFLNSLPEDLRKIVLEEGKNAAVLERKLSLEDKDLAFQELSGQNIQLNAWSSEQKAKDKKMFADVYKQYDKKFGAEAIRLIESL